MDTGFFEKLQVLQADGSLNKDDFNALLQEYLDQCHHRKERGNKDRKKWWVTSSLHYLSFNFRQLLGLLLSNMIKPQLTI